MDNPKTNPKGYEYAHYRGYRSWGPPLRFSFNPTLSPPNFSAASILKTFLRFIDRLPASEFGSVKYRLLVEELCDFVEGVDADMKLGLESKLIKLVSEPKVWEAKPTGEVPRGCFLGPQDDLGKLPQPDCCASNLLSAVPRLVHRDKVRSSESGVNYMGGYFSSFPYGPSLYEPQWLSSGNQPASTLVDTSRSYPLPKFRVLSVAKLQARATSPSLEVELVDMPTLTSSKREPPSTLGQIELSDLGIKHTADTPKAKSSVGTKKVQVTSRGNPKQHTVGTEKIPNPDVVSWVREFLGQGMMFKAGEESDHTVKAGEHSISADGPVVGGPDTTDVYGGTDPISKQREVHHEHEGVVSLRWDREQWLSVLVRLVNIEKEGSMIAHAGTDGSEFCGDWIHINPGRESKPPGSMPVGLDAHPVHVISGLEDRNELHKLEIPHSGSIGFEQPTPDNDIQVLTEFLGANADQVQYEGYNLTLSLEIELVLTSGNENAGPWALEDISAVFKKLPSARVQSIRDIKSGSFSSIVFDADADMKDRMLGLQGFRQKQEVLATLGLEIEQLRCIQWRKIVLPKIFESLRKFDTETGDHYTLSVHIGRKGGYDLQEIKRIAKTIMLYGDLFDYTKDILDSNLPPWPTRPDFGSSRHNPKTKHASNSQLIENIDRAASLADVVEIMNPDIYDMEEYRFKFCKLESQGTIVWTQSFPTSYNYVVTGWIDGILSVTTAAIKIKDSDIIELAKNDASWDNLGLLLKNDGEGIHKLSVRRTETEK